MATIPAARLPNRAPVDTGWGSLATPLLALVFALLGFVLLKQGTDFVADERPKLIFVWCEIIGMVATALAPARYQALPRYARTLLRASGTFLVLYFALEPFAIPYAARDMSDPSVLFHSHARWVGAGLALLGLWRPAGLFASAMVLWMMRELQTGLTGFYFSTLDIRNVAEVIAFWSLGLAWLDVASRSARLSEITGLDRAGRATSALMLFAAGVGAHLANYFWSGLAKLALDGGPLSWLFDNRLYEGIPGALEKGTLPLAIWPVGVDILETVLRTVAVPINLAAFAVQIFAVFAPLRRRWLILTIIGFDLFHIAVWFALGLLFWKWIALNTILLLTLSRMSDSEWRPLAQRTTMVFVVAGMAMFKTATLAWYDSPGFASPYFVAEMRDGTRFRIPSAYFLSSSYQVSQGRIWHPGGPDHFNPSIWGSVLHHRDLLAGRDCRIAPGAAGQDEAFGQKDAIGRFVQAHHKRITAMLDDQGRFNYYRVPHHHVPSPFLADPFAATDKRQIARYVYVMDSVCLSLDHGHLVRRVLNRSEVPVYDVVKDRPLS
ncbi:hypothetical protein [Novosphingobium aquimarinum]|uniref:hypothetical protein n=1 Tax=Novosphingobium aquimarinum TaxID=2682494 RepID=UPI0012EC5FAA|nr:hypothetical protein [Novosphingobium aquimarinum]